MTVMDRLGSANVRSQVVLITFVMLVLLEPVIRTAMGRGDR
jgi:hypothetical protein